LSKDRASGGLDFRYQLIGTLNLQKTCDIEVSAGKVIGSIYSTSSEGGRGGDIYYFGVCKGDTITRLAIADVTGHGEAVSEISQYVYDSLKAHM